MSDSPRIRVIVKESDEVIDFDAWCATFMRRVVAAYRAKQQAEAA